MDSPNETRIKVKVIPRSSKNGISGILADGTIKLKIIAPPVDGKANQNVIRFLSDLLHIPVASIGILSGATNPIKLISIKGLNKEEVDRIFLDLLKKSTGV